MSSFRKNTLLVKRRPAGNYNVSTGNYDTSGSGFQFEIKASVQPMTGQEMLLLPENRRDRETLKIYSNAELFGTEKGNVFNNDIVIINNNSYEVTRVFKWGNKVINHYKYFLSKMVSNDYEVAV